MADDRQTPEAQDDDKPVPLEATMPPEIASPLAPFVGKSPPYPEWFQKAIERAPHRALVPVDGANIELLTWGERGKPGLIFVHGNSAHADWWSFICPFFADQPFWGRQVHRLDAGPEPIAQKRLTSQRLALAIKHAVTAPALSQAARNIQRELQAERAIDTTVAWIERWMGSR